MKYMSINDGFTVVELLATMVISSLVVAFVFSMYLFVERLVGSWEKRTDLETLVDGCAGQIERDLTSCWCVDECSDSLLVLQMTPVDTVVYRFGGDNVSRGDILFGPKDTRLDAFVSDSEDTAAAYDEPVRIWSIRVLGQRGRFKDSSSVVLVTAMSSDEMVREEMKTTASGKR